MHLLGQHLRGHFEVHEEVFAVVLAHGRGEQGRGQQTNSECDNRRTSEHKSSQRIHREKHGMGIPNRWTIKEEEGHQGFFASRDTAAL
jgi:hypothetical protein